MKRKCKANDAFYDYLAPILETGDDADIETARREWRKQYKRNWLRQKRAKDKQFTVSFTPHEHQVLQRGLKDHRYAAPQLIKRACLAYLQQSFVVPDQTVLTEFREALLLNYYSLEKLEDMEVMTEENTKEILRSLRSAQERLDKYFERPITIEAAIQTAVKLNPDFKLSLLNLLQSL